MNESIRKRKVRLADAAQITSDLWIGGELCQTDAALARRQLRELMDAGVDAIIDSRFTQNDIDWITDENPKIDYLSLGVEDAGFVMPDEWFEQGTQYALEQIGDGHVVLTHCQMGVNRGSSMGIAILLTQSWDPIDALQIIKDRRPIARMIYAEDAVRWWLMKQGASIDDLQTQLDRIEQWRIDRSCLGKVAGV